MADIFINYRRKDSAHEARRIYDWLAARLGPASTFMDFNGIEPGENFHEAIHHQIVSAKVMLVVIGKRWAFAENSNGTLRLDEPHDIVRREIFVALEEGLRVVPVLVSGAALPQAVDLPSALTRLTRLNAFSVGEQSFEDDVERLAGHIGKWIVKSPDKDAMEYEPGTLQRKVCMVGQWGVGKTSLVSRYVKGMFSEKYLSTLGVAISTKQMQIGETNFKMMLWDLAGEDALTSLKPIHLRGAAGIILVTDGRNSALRSALDLRERCRDALGPIPMVLAANKFDLCRESWSWEYTMEALDEITENLRLTVFTTSALTGVGVEFTFQHLARQILKAESQQL